MAVPTVTSITPAIGPSGGFNQVEIIGTGFNVPVLPPPSGGPAGPFVNTVKVLFGASASFRVLVITDTRLIVIPPISSIPALAANNHGEGLVDVIVTNLDGTTGLPISGETVTVTDGYTYLRPQLTDRSDLLRLVENMVLELKRQIIPNISISTNTDYDSDTGDMLNITDLATFPGIAIAGPSLITNRFFSANQEQNRPLAAAGEFASEHVPKTVDVMFALIGVTNSKIELINLMHATHVFFLRNTELQLLRDAGDPSLGTVSFEIALTEDGDLKTIGIPNESNIRAFGGSFVIRGFDIESLTGFEKDLMTNAGADTLSEGVLVGVEQTGEVFDVGPSPGRNSC